MTKYVVAIALWFVAIAPLGALAQSDERAESVERAANAGQVWFDRMARALRSLNFEATLVQSQGQRIQPLVWLHGSYDHNTDIELLIYLNGADTRALRIGDQTYYYSQAGGSYTLQSDVTFGLIPPAFYKPFTQINAQYQVIASGGMRVTGRNAQYLRLISRDDNRYHYDLWVDRESGMLLKLQMMTPQGEILEQLQVTSIAFSEVLPEQLTEVSDIQRPPKLYDLQQLTELQFALRPQWLPAGFELRRAHHRKLHDTPLPTDYFLYSDGLTEVSIYVTDQRTQALPNLALQGPESIVNSHVNGFAVTVVGKMPAETLRRIGESMTVTATQGNPQ
ncbi:MucB/RseB C-terminal domain-containing protein [Pseudidiomarina gelatinasegens]|uniref:MucB/RseB C-terminal domain-containing protein n=1 Tax=Pseudidiomarina gelatinasegens TaxID=2487740 RepID=UPI003A974D79